ncbi:exodeoxyribonuclease-3 [Evansella caseinilytica]|uniref:Exodeoxyribonuclease-3 n=1 Tax=Evansella caseinilytica TaxID=1503961 RepID=A0A1H3PEE4_9BACI|nr:exodeoxyribonuclease III [Evansella caseinilytica]SDY99451.1 exodeoxyribonuclease-3 [Evansella caseinilytica]
MKLISWNVNGIRACVKKGFLNYFTEIDADIFAIQETKLQAGQLALELPGYEQYWNCAERKGYSGTAIFTKKKPLSVRYGMGIAKHDTEGRLITLEFPAFYFVTVYTPNSRRDLSRLDYRLEWEKDLLAYINELDQRKPVVLCGDLNVAHQAIDLKNPKANAKNSGFTKEERERMSAFLACGYVDSFRLLHPDREGAYTWWSYMNNVRARNIGWRIDYFIVSASLKKAIRSAEIHPEVLRSDHCPVAMTLVPDAL